jgi:hypothetical protein
MFMAENWQTLWPIEEGLYWFFGVAHKCEVENRLRVVRVRGAGERLFYIVDGSFLYKSEGATGVFLRLLEPQIPDGIS